MYKFQQIGFCCTCCLRSSGELLVSASKSGPGFDQVAKICIDDKFYNEMLSAPKKHFWFLFWLGLNPQSLIFSLKKCDEEVFCFFFWKVYCLILDRNRFVLSGAKHVADPSLYWTHRDETPSQPSRLTLAMTRRERNVSKKRSIYTFHALSFLFFFVFVGRLFVPQVTPLLLAAAPARWSHPAWIDKVCLFWNQLF